MHIDKLLTTHQMIISDAHNDLNTKATVALSRRGRSGELHVYSLAILYNNIYIYIYIYIQCPHWLLLFCILMVLSIIYSIIYYAYILLSLLSSAVGLHADCNFTLSVTISKIFTIEMCMTLTMIVRIGERQM